MNSPRIWIVLFLGLVLGFCLGLFYMSTRVEAAEYRYDNHIHVQANGTCNDDNAHCRWPDEYMLEWCAERMVMEELDARLKGGGPDPDDDDVTRPL